ncbi:MAG: ISAs1 family transposase [Chloroflexi bacterium]|nr:ISAs1 family transposase [Chloroflexota bacterium]
MDNVPLSIAERSGILEDPRTGHAKRHELLDIIVITLCAVICGADNWVEIGEFGKAREDWFRQFLQLPNGIPSHDTFGRVLRLLDPEQFSTCFMDWVRSVNALAQGEVVAIDGKTLRAYPNSW